MDGCLGQLHLITKEEVLDAEAKLKITANKQSPARTAVEQAADVGAMFKLIRALIKSMPGGEPSNSHIYHLLLQGLNELGKEYITVDNMTYIMERLSKQEIFLSGQWPGCWPTHSFYPQSTGPAM